VFVGVCVERSLEMVVGLLGILKAGGAYVPLDPSAPEERLSFMIQDANMPLLLTQQRLLKSLPQRRAHLVCLDTNWEAIDQEVGDNLDAGVVAGNLAYLIYTSGSTGLPKGVAVEHRSLVAYTETSSAEFALSPSDRVLQFASITFDAAAEEIYPSLTRGATLVLRGDSMLDSAASFLEECRAWRLTVLDLPTAYWHHLVLELGAQSLAFPPSVRLVILGGEKALRERLDAWWEAVDQPLRLLNTYGPTETTVVATWCDLPGPAEGEAARPEVPIGQPIHNAQAYVLDPHLQLAPVGIPGELHIGGVGLARGYLNQPALTAERFIPHPFSEAPGARLYRTGDLARYLHDGNIEFLGRLDHQVKIRGFRVELGEIEAVLSQHPAVRDAVAVVGEGPAGDKRLLAYVVPRAPHGVPSTAELRLFLKRRLPDYMVPSTFVGLKALPLTPSRKVDRQALPAPDQSRPQLEVRFVAPRTLVEEALAAIWADVLGLQRVGIRDDFFELGGHSLLATQVTSRVSTIFRVEVPLRRLFENPTVAGLSRVLVSREARPGQAESIARALKKMKAMSPADREQALHDRRGTRDGAQR
jgi:amino acid adenylation domain-containing protein